MDFVVWIMLGVFMLFIYVSNKRRKDAAIKLEDSIQVGARVIMAGGIIGNVTHISEKTVVIESTPGVKLEFVKAAVRSVEEPPVQEQVAKPKKPVTKNKPTK